MLDTKRHYRVGLPGFLLIGCAGWGRCRFLDDGPSLSVEFVSCFILYLFSLFWLYWDFRYCRGCGSVFPWSHFMASANLYGGPTSLLPSFEPTDRRRLGVSHVASSRSTHCVNQPGTASSIPSSNQQQKSIGLLRRCCHVGALLGFPSSRATIIFGFVSFRFFRLRLATGDRRLGLLLIVGRFSFRFVSFRCCFHVTEFSA